MMRYEVSLLSREKFNIELCGFGSFPPFTIFMDVKKNERLNDMQDQLFKFSKKELQLFNAQYKDLPFHPHLTLAFRDLKKDKFALAWSEFENRPYNESFLADRITVLKQDDKYWHSWSSFNF